LALRATALRLGEYFASAEEALQECVHERLSTKESSKIALIFQKGLDEALRIANTRNSHDDIYDYAEAVAQKFEAILDIIDKSKK